MRTSNHGLATRRRAVVFAAGVAFVATPDGMLWGQRGQGRIGEQR